MTIIQLPDAYNFSGTIRDIVVDATEKLDFTLSSNGVTIVSETYYPSSDNRITINLRDILEDIIEPVLYEVAETGIPQYTYQIGETTGNFYCIAGGIDAEVSVESYLQGNFLTWQPQTRVTLYHIPHYLRYVSVVESICKVKAFFSDGTSEVAVLKTFSAKSINTVNVTFGTIRGMFESQPTYFDVWVENLEGEMLTWIQRYMLTDFLTGVNDYFIFANSLGGFDTIRFSGDREEINKLDSVNAVFDNETKEYDIDRTRSWKKYTGYITDERIRMWVLDFFNSPCRYHLTDSGLLKRIYISDHKLESTTGDAVGYEFTYVYSVQSRYINIERTSTPPLLEITDPQSEIFFLAPKLNQFELAKIESETDYLFPVQSPMAGKWLAISLRTILNFVSSKGLDVDALQIYLTDHKYATQDWVKEQNYLTSANMDDYVLKKTWDSVFELAEVNGKQVLKIKYDVIGNLGITAYGTGPDSGGSFTGSLVDLVDVSVSGLKTGDILKYNGTHFVNVPLSSISGASSWEQISGKPEYFPTRWSYIKDAPESLPASDVYPWAKASTKPSYTWDEITGKPSVFTPDSHTHVWANITDRPTKLSQFQDDVVVGNYVPQTTWDSVFELAEVNGQRVLKIKYDVVGNWGITAYGTGPDSGGSFTGSLVDLVDVAVSGLKAGDILKYDGTHFVNVPIASIAGASSWEQISGKPDYFPTLWSEIKDAPESLPASDVYPWAKAATKPSYAWDEITGKPTSLPANGGNADTVDNLHASAFARTDQNPNVDLNTVNGFGIMSNYGSAFATPENNYPINLAGTLFYGNAASDSSCQIYGAYNVNRWFVRAGKKAANQKTEWQELWHTGNFTPSNKLDKSVWDEAFEIKTVNGIRVISAKLDVLGQKGISAYADSADSGSAGGGLDYELLKNALTGIITPDGYPFTISSKFLGAIDKSYITGQIGDLYADAVHTHKWSDITDHPTALPASDVYSWAKAATKPSYTWNEIAGKPSSFTPASHTHLWANITDRPTSLPANGGNADSAVKDGKGNVISNTYFTNNQGEINESDILSYSTLNNGTYRVAGTGYSNILAVFKCSESSVSSLQLYCDYSSDLQFRIALDGNRYASFKKIWHSGNFTPSNKLDKSVWDEAFEIKTVNGIRVISAKLDVLGQKGISAYADSADSGSAGGGLDYELLKNALTGIITPDGYPFTISSKFLGAIDKSYITGKIGDLYADAVHTHKWTDIADRPTSLPANGGNADTVDGLHSYDFARRSEFIAGTDLNSINGFGLFQTSTNSIATSEKHYPISEAGILIYGNAAYNSSCQIYGSYNSNRWFVRGGGNGPSEKTPWAEIWTTKNFDPNDYLPLSGGKTITGDFSVSAGVKIKSNEANIIGRFVFGSIADYRTIVGAFDYDTLLISKSALKRNTNGTEYTIYDSGNLTKLSQLQDDVVSGNYFKLSANRVTNLNDTPINSFFVSSQGPANSPASSAFFVNGFCIAADNSSIFKKQLVYADDWYVRSQGNGSWGGWSKLWHSGNFNPASKADLSLSFISKRGSINDANLNEFIKRPSGTYSVVRSISTDLLAVFQNTEGSTSALELYCDYSSNLQFRIALDNNRYASFKKIWHSGNLNLSTVDFAAKNINASETGTFKKLVINGIVIEVVNGNLRVNGNLVATGGVTSQTTA